MQRLFREKETQLSYAVKPVTRPECADYILNIHYAKRWPSISYSYGLYRDGALVGVCTFGTPPSSPLRKGVAGEKYKNDVLELNRLVLKDNQKNEASLLVGRSLKLLPKNRIVVSFADTAQGHIGTVYQASNFIYTGLSAKRTDWKIRGKEHLHGVTIADEFRHIPGKGRAQMLREKYGSDFYLKDRPRKHRYLFIVGSRSYRNAARSSIKYPIQDYPKLEISDGVLAADRGECRLCGEPYCDVCDAHYADCDCVSPFQIAESQAA